MNTTMYANTWTGPRKVVEVIEYRTDTHGRDVIVQMKGDTWPQLARPGDLFITADSLSDCPDCAGDGWILTPLHGINAPDSHHEELCIGCGGTGLAG